jgi:hypothetical protein
VRPSPWQFVPLAATSLLPRELNSSPLLIPAGVYCQRRKKTSPIHKSQQLQYSRKKLSLEITITATKHVKLPKYNQEREWEFKRPRFNN